MRHQKKGFKLGRTTSHRKATLSAMTNALIRHKRITTTITKAKALRMYAEPIINRGKVDSTLNRRQVFRHLQDKESVKELFGEISGKIQGREGGYLRIVKLGQRAGDAAEMAIIEFVDYNDVKPFGSSTGSGSKTRRAGRRRGGAGKAAAAAPAAVFAEEVLEEATAEVAEAPAEELVAEAEAPAEEPAAEAEAPAEEPKAEAADDEDKAKDA